MAARRTAQKDASRAKAKKRETKSKRQTARSKPKGSVCPIVGIGGSAGGFEAAMELLRNLPSRTGMAFVIVQHLDPHHASRLSSLLGKVTAMPVSEVTETTTPTPNKVYVQPPNKCVIAKNGTLTVVPREERVNVAINRFFESLAEECGSHSIGIVLSGTGTDGTAGLRAIKAAGGLTFAQRLQRSEQRYKALFHLIPVAAYACDAHGVITEFNRRAAELWGDQPTEKSRFCGSCRIYYPDGRPMPHEECPMARALRGKKLTPKDLEIIIERSNGERRHVISAPRVVTNERGKIVGAVNCLFDITDRKEAETAARRLAAAVQSSHDAIAAKTLNGIITDWNQSAERIFGYKSKEIIGKSILTLIPKDRHHEERLILGKIRRGESIEHYETVRRRKDGKLIDVSLTISPIKGPAGEIVGVSKIARDITEQKQTLRRLAEQARLLDLSNEAILVRDSRDHITYWNHGAEELYGYSVEEALGKVTHKLLQTKHSEPLEQIYKKLKLDGRWSGELLHTRKDGEKITVVSNWALDRDKFGRRGYILETNTDITRRKHAEIELKRSKDLLEELVDERTKALRTAIAELKGEIERRKGLEGEILSISDREQQRLGQELHDGLCQHLTAVAFMARSVALRLRNHRAIDAADIDKIAELVNDAATDTRNLSRALHRFDVDSAGLIDSLQDLVDREFWRVPCRLEMKPSFQINDDAAAAHLYRIAREAVINANKHAHARQIVVKLERNRKEMILRVIDDGIGFPKNLKPEQGLGFHIMTYRAHLMGGRLEIDSAQTGGTRVSCYFPVDAAQPNKLRNGERPIGAPLKF